MFVQQYNRHGSALEHSMCFLFLHVPATVVRLGPCASFWLMPVNRWEVRHSPFEVLKSRWGASLVAQWLRICLLMQGTRVRALVWEDPICRGATKPVSHNC